MRFPEQALKQSILRHLGWGYSLGNARYPASIPGWRTKLGPPRQTNCCIFVNAALMGAVEISGQTLEWGRFEHRLASLQGAGEDAFGPVSVVVHAGLGELVDPDAAPEPGAYYVMQGWTKDPIHWKTYKSGGHTVFLAGGSHLPVSIEANVMQGRSGFRGIGHRGIGAYSGDIDHVLALTLEETPNPWMWTRWMKRYPWRRMAKLNVDF